MDFQKVFFLVCLVFLGFAQAQDPMDALEKTYHQEGLAGLRREITQLKDQKRANIGILNRLANRLKEKKESGASLEVFKLNCEVFPESVFAYLGLAEAARESGKGQLARETLAKAATALDQSAFPQQRKENLAAEITRQNIVLKHFHLPGEANLNLAVYFGGAPAGKWDAVNLLTFARGHKEQSFGYQATNLYMSPVPGIDGPFSHGVVPDILSTFAGGDTRRLAEAGKLADLSELWKQQNWDKTLVPNLKGLASVNGKPMFVPQAFQANPIWYRVDLFKKLNLEPPKTWKGFLDLCETIAAKGYTPFSISVKDWTPPVARWFTILNLRLHGANFHQRLMAGEIAYTDARVRQTFLHWRQLFQHRAFAQDSAQSTYAKGINDLFEGKTVMYNLGEWMFESKLSAIRDQLDFFSVPPITAGIPRSEIVHLYGTALTTKGSQREVARKLVAFLGSRDSQQSNLDSLKRTQAHLKVSAQSYHPVQKRLIQWVAQADSVVPLFEFNTHPEIATAGLKAFVAFWNDPQGDLDVHLTELERVRKKLCSP